MTARLRFGEPLGDRALKVDHAGEHGAVNIYRGQLTACRYRDPALRRELDEFRRHEESHRDMGDHACGVYHNYHVVTSSWLSPE